MKNKFIISGATCLAIGVILGAFGAHALKEILTEKQLANWHTGVHYQFIHGLGILALASTVGDWTRRRAKTILAFFIIGVLLFSGSLYGLSTVESSSIRRILGPMTPIGGICFIIGWLLTIITALRQAPNN